MMAVDLNNSELLLPSQFFTPQDLHGLSLDNSNSSSNKPINQNASYYVFGSTDSWSEFSSPIGSELSSSSTESSEEEDDYSGELTRQMAQYMLQDEDKHEKSWGLAGSPESTLWSQLWSNLYSPVGPSRGPSPPLTPVVGNFEKMKINEETARYNQGERFISTSTSIQVSRSNPYARFQSKRTLVDDQIRAIQFHRLKQEQAQKQMEQKPRVKHYQSKGRVFSDNGQKAASDSNNPWYTRQQQQQQQQQQQSNQQAGSDMRAVFLNASGSRNGSCGTGVFLPRGIGTPCESRKKQGCATVLIPARVLQALKLHFEKTGVPSRFNSGFPLEHDASVSGRNSMYSQQKRQPRTVPALNHQDVGLPQEWTY
ncbi:serine/threonine-protein kinase pakD [Herrania umbratica]|uniref:Serine/threonine-protein kinase pakD n=1 Tax=Herrania umbratica TaxID=108875 RepID=A0A6J0ZTF1_9ROSI|nr:serine/threonine-protein kinase pakD [Herrania umbratica]